MYTTRPYQTLDDYRTLPRVSGYWESPQWAGAGTHYEKRGEVIEGGRRQDAE